MSQSPGSSEEGYRETLLRRPTAEDAAAVAQGATIIDVASHDEHASAEQPPEAGHEAAGAAGSGDIALTVLDDPFRVADAPDTAGEGAAECRICGEEGHSGDPVIAPCGCAGSIRGVHATCLQKWIETRPDSAADTSLVCELCHEPYRVHFDRQFVCDREHTCSLAACSQMSEGCVLVFCLCCIVSMMFILPWDDTQSSSEQSIVIVLFIGTTIFSLFVLRTVFRRWQAASSISTLVGDAGTATTPHSRDSSA